MSWYDWFASIYDNSIEAAYREYRAPVAEALAPASGSLLLDVPCGTGQAFPELVKRLGDDGTLVGVDQSEGMLKKAGMRVDKAGWQGVHLVRASADAIPREAFGSRAEAPTPVDALHVFLGMSVFSDMEETFGRLWSLLRPGGRCVLVDVHAERLGLQGFMVNRIARAEIRRRFWEPLERSAEGFELRDLPFQRQHGGQIMLAVGTKPQNP
ncbi:MAG: class I SAM-dependent methyltransferase [Myxococcales bacterium]|nr:class I SAM-dependent methyltransferase [Myxococcales bacterium]